MSQKRRKRGSVVFSWHRSLTMLTPWRKGKGDAVLDGEVVLTKMKLFNNFADRLSMGEDSISTISISISEQDVCDEPRDTPDGSNLLHTVDELPVSEPKHDYLSVFSEQKLSGLYKFESEDSGVELPSGADSPSTPTGSEQSFNVHSRQHSCDSQELRSSGPTSDSRPVQDVERTDAEHQLQPPEETAEKEMTQMEEGISFECTQAHHVPHVEANGLHVCQEEPTGDTCEECRAAQSMESTTEASNHTMEEDVEQKSLRKSTTSNSLDEYMEECCRLSEVHQAQTNPLGQGLGYLEHICRLIEKIGQLQEHNLKLQKQIGWLQKEGRGRNTKEDFYLQRCCCGAASQAFSQPKFISGTSSSSIQSDLSTIPEVTRQPCTTRCTDAESEGHSPLPLWRKALNRRSYAEGEARYFCATSENISPSHRKVNESHTWGRVKDLVKKSRLRNHSRLAMTSGSLKRSCPQLYRPDIGPVELPRRNRNSMITLGHQSKLD